MNEQPKNEHAAPGENRQVEQLDQGSPADAEQDERKPTESGKKAADAIQSVQRERAKDGA
jgi:hypothetical protein